MHIFKQDSRVVTLIKDWQWQEASPDKESWTQCKYNPSQIHLELLDAKVIADPNIGMNETGLQWIGERDWEYKSCFHVASLDACEFADLVFEGLDTFATVSLNGSHILSSDNAFHTHRVNVKANLRVGINILRLHFASAIVEGHKLYKRNGEGIVWNGDPSRLHVRKPQYHYGWDWGPVLMTCGPWKPVMLEQYNTRISDLRVETSIYKKEPADIKLDIAVHPASFCGDFQVECVTPDGTSLRATVSARNGKAKHVFTISAPELWYPVGYGAQPLYTVSASLGRHTLMARLGLRVIELVQHSLEGQPGTSFFFRVNGVPIFAGGSNWIPADNFHCRLTRKDYFAWVKRAVDGGQNMLRVWGGGIYESDDFYDACDEYGILVWQDMMFGCGQYPAGHEFMLSVKKEAIDNLTRLRHHPCLALFSGGNEDYQVCESYNLTWDKDDTDWERVAKSNFPARAIYEHLLPEAVSAVSPWIPYWPSSPFGGTSTRDPTVGDVHQWNVWHGTQEPYQDYGKLGGRFVSEFGMQGLSDIKTHNYYLRDTTDARERHPQSKTNVHHNKADGSERRLAVYLNENFRYNMGNLEDYIYATQLMQHEALSYAYRMWRREWRGDRREYCAGVLVWQLNDCWPCTSWAICDYFLRPKAAYFGIKRELRPIHGGLQRRRDEKFPTLKAKLPASADQMQAPGPPFYYGPWLDTVDVWALNNTLEAFSAKIVVEAYHVESGQRDESFRFEKVITVLANSSTDVSADVAISSEQAESCVLALTLTCVLSGTVVGRSYDWPQPFKYLHFPKRRVSVDVDESGKLVRVSADRPVKGLVLSCEHDVDFADNCIDLVPGQVHEIALGHYNGEKISARWYGDEEE
ncbi:glycoside hydrolase superfamily [Protomyces lactucae-debilis]|uniref:Beta-mannosidase B n=1 Tax=Protomyces lactucae-debilis TaxID=2754530 RepID=A0A1Y2F3I9_PROLT|nr:glycoside hydrolase superfamily [Protomyces lactucae-debilis]ORY78257.1 glycoside hydrolase superfamily [Protomyces lactucae-debilis]